MKVAILDTNRQLLAPVSRRRADLLLDSGKAAVLRIYPFTLILKEAKTDVVIPDLILKLDPGSKKTGLTIVDQTTGEIIFAAEIKHRGQQVKAALQQRAQQRRARRNRKKRYRKPRFLNRTRKPGWLPPSLESSLANLLTWVRRLLAIYPIKALAVESVKFDTQLLANPEIAGVEYQQGELAGFEVKEYLLLKWGHKCCYCGAEHVPLQIEHLVPRSRHGSNRVSNLGLACQRCNQKKGNLTAAEFDFPHLHEQAKKPLRDAAAVNATRHQLLERLQAFGLPVETGSGGQTKYNRTKRGLPKTHWLDAACVGASTPETLTLPAYVLLIQATGHGSRQRCRTDKYGFPKVHLQRKKTFQGWQTGDIARVTTTKGKLQAGQRGRITIRQRPGFQLQGHDIHPKYLTRLHRRDGYGYATTRADNQMALTASTALPA